MNDENKHIQKILKEYISYYSNEKNALLQLQDFIMNSKNIMSKFNTVGHLTASGYIYAKEDKKL